MDRLDKVVSNQLGYSRKEVKELSKRGRIAVNDKIMLKSDVKIDPQTDLIKVDGKEVVVKKFAYLVLNKPQGYVSATEDKNDMTVLELVPTEYAHRNLFPAGRLDKDTTGLMLITDDGEFAHNILSPKKHIKKIYEVTIDIPVTNEMKEKFKAGICLNGVECKPSELEITGKFTSRVTLVEGKYHQIKRMFGCFGAKVLRLNRICMGNFFLPLDLDVGMVRELTKEELELIKGIHKKI